MFSNKGAFFIHRQEVFPIRENFLYKSIEVKDGIEIYGRGLFSREQIKTGEYIFSFNGTFASKEIASPLALQVGNKLYLETDPAADYENSINHACYTITHKPNCEIIFNFSRRIDESLIGQHSRPNEVVLAAISDIKADDQVFIDYATTEEDMDDPQEGQLCSFDCNCGQNCRKHIGDFANLTEEQAQLLYPHMSPYIQKLAKNKFGENIIDD